jgi:hypothetical protein
MRRSSNRRRHRRAIEIFGSRRGILVDDEDPHGLVFRSRTWLCH